jgi:uroporphyrinogen-III synthase
MSLRGITVAVTSSRRASELADIVRKFGGIPYIAPTIGIKNNSQLNSECNHFIETISNESMHFFIFMTGVGVFNLFQNLQKLHKLNTVIEKLQDTIVVARSNKPKMELRKFGIKTNFVPNINTIDGILILLKHFDVKNKNIGILWHGDSSSSFKKELASLGANVFDFSSYSYSARFEQTNASMLEEMGYDYVAPNEEKIKMLIEDIMKGTVDSITFTSPPAVKEFFEFAKRNNKINSLKDKLNNNVLVVSVGPSTSKMLARFYVLADIMPPTYRMGPMIKELADYVSSY